MRTRVVLFSGLFVISLLLVAAPAWAYDRTEADACDDCHFYPGDVVMHFTVGAWLPSEHALTEYGFNENTYCAACHSPFQADPAATDLTNDPVSLDEWEAVTCGSCHPPHDLRVQWGTPMGIYDIEAEEWSPIYEEEADELCLHCHSCSHCESDFQGFGKAMTTNDVRCVDCHMPKVPNTQDASDPTRLTRSHTLQVFDTLPYSCGTVEGGCHSNHKDEWAEKQVLKGKIHGKK